MSLKTTVQSHQPQVQNVELNLPMEAKHTLQKQKQVVVGQLTRNDCDGNPIYIVAGIPAGFRMPGVGGSSCMSSESPAEAPSAVVPAHSYADFGAYAAKLAHFIQKVPKVGAHWGDSVHERV